MKQFLILLLVLMPVNVSATYEALFYSIYQDDDCIEPSGPVDISIEKIMAIAERVCIGKKNFIGFEDNEGTTIQFYVDEVDKIWMEIPVANENGSYGKHISQQEFLSFIKSMKKPYIKYKSSLYLKFKKW